MNLITQDREYEFAQEPPKFSFVLSGIDTLECKIQPDIQLDNEPSEVIINGHIRGVINDFAFAEADKEVSTRVKVNGELAKLDNFVIKSKYSAKNENIITFLNKNPAGIVFANNNLLAQQLYFSSKIVNKSWYDTLVELSKNLGFEFWYNYDLGVCNLGSPDKIIELDDENFEFEADRFAPPSVVSFDFKSVYNRIIAKADQLNAIGLEDVSNYNQSYPILQRVDEFAQQYYCIEDPESIAKYGLKELFINSPSLNQSSTGSTVTKDQLANLLYEQAYRLILKHKEPQTTITGLTAIGDKNLVKIGNKLKISRFFENHNRIIEGSYFVTKIEYSVDRQTDTYLYNLTLMNYLDKQSLADNILNRFQRVDELPPNSVTENKTVTLTTSTTGQTSTGSYTTSQSLNLGITQYIINISATQTTTTIGTSCAYSSLAIDGIVIPISLLTTNNSLVASYSLDISTLESLSQNQKNQIYSNIAHSISLSSQSNASVNVTISISIKGYN